MRKSMLFILVLVTMILPACSGPAMMPSRSAETDNGEAFMLALPRLVLTVDENGQSGIEGLPLAALGLGSALPQVSPEFVAQMEQANIQHIELRHTGDALALMVNGNPIPRLAWGDDSIETMGMLFSLFGAQSGETGDATQQLLMKVAPIVQRLGLSVALKFPTAADAQELPFASDEVVMAAPRTADVEPSTVAQLEVKYDDQGVPSIMGISARDIAMITGNSSLPLALSPDVIARAQAMNLQHLQLTTGPDGLSIYLNGKPVPKLIWDQGMVSNVIDVLTQLNPEMSANAEMLKQLAPILTNTSLSVLIHFPMAAGVEAIPVHMQ